MCFKTIVNIFTGASWLWKIIKIVLIVLALWFTLSYLNKEVGIFSWITSIFKFIANGIGKLVKIVTLNN